MQNEDDVTCKQSDVVFRICTKCNGGSGIYKTNTSEKYNYCQIKGSVRTSDPVGAALS